MGKSCCESKSSELALLRERQGHILKIVLLINLAMFFVEFTSGVFAKSSALKADSLDMLGDASVYAFSLYALNRGAAWRARAGMMKGLLMAGFGVFVIIETIHRFMSNSFPQPELMGVVGFIALAANATCLVLLYRHRGDDINMRSTWLCSRNDIIANTGVLVASALVAVTNSGLPDFIVGVAIAGLFLKSAFQVITEARFELTRTLPGS